MAHILITHANSKEWYTPIASIKLYNEPDFEAKLWRYSNEIFLNYHVFKFKFGLSCKEIPGKNFEPDLLLVSKDFKKWVIIEVELCKAPTQHTLDQITCFSNPKFIASNIAEYIIKNNKVMSGKKSKLIDCFSNNVPDLIVVLDDYSDTVFRKFYNHKKQLKICVLEVYKKLNYSYEGFRFGGDYPYQLTNSSKLEFVDEQHYKVIKKDFIKDLPNTFEVKFEMFPFKASLIKLNAKTTYIKIPFHNIPSDVYLQIGKSIKGEFVIQKI